MSVFGSLPEAPDQRDPDPEHATPPVAAAPQLVPPSLQAYPDTLVQDDFEAPSNNEQVPVAAGVAAGVGTSPVAPVPVVPASEPTWNDGAAFLESADTAPQASTPSQPAPPADASAFPQRTIVRWASIVFGVFLAMLLAVGGLWLVTGGRYYIVTTPSMSPALPVGSLVLTKPYKQAEVVKGTIIAFTAPSGTYRTITHRVVDIVNDGYVTKGDSNRVADPEVVPFGNVKGIVVAVLPGVGWLMRALPWLLLGLLIAIGLAAFVPWRWGVFMPIVAVVIVLTIPLLILKPLVRGEMGAQWQTNNAAYARVINTGLLPLKVSSTDNPPVHLAPGHWADLRFPVGTTAQKYGINATVDLTLMGWLVLGFLCCIPLLIGVAIAFREWRKERAGTLMVPTS